jgi:hypothetical protein
MTTIQAERDFRLRLAGVTETTIVFRGNPNACLKLAKQLGLGEGRFVGSVEMIRDDFVVFPDGTDANFTFCEFPCGAFVVCVDFEHDDYVISIPLSVWSEAPAGVDMHV